MISSNDVEVCKLERHEAEALAIDYSRYSGRPAKVDPRPKIPYSLLSAEHILEYVETTGLIAPFFIKGGKSSRLKDAAYEGRIGEVAYQYMPGENFPKVVFTSLDEFLLIPKNSIVFVECDLDFRLPEFIALRFNLQIKHVHRGLLLGTGPLVDPGYWGKLCIPLHNLTDEDYVINKSEGLIWLEFTKTTSKVSLTAERLGRPPLSKPFWDVKEFLIKATTSVDASSHPVGIRSAIPSVFRSVEKSAEEAKVAAERSAIAAARSKQRVVRQTFWGIVGGGLAVAALLVGIVSLSWNYYSDMDRQYSQIRPEIAELKVSLQQAQDSLSRTLDATELTTRQLNLAREQLEAANGRIGMLEMQVIDLSRIIEVPSSEFGVEPVVAE